MSGKSVARRSLNLRWASPGPVSSAFMKAKASVQCLMGPVGGGKTTTILMKSVMLTRAQRPSLFDNVRKFKLCVVRDTYRQLWKSTIPSWWKRVPRETGEWSGPQDGPATHEVGFDYGDGTVGQLIVDFVAIGEHRAEDVLRGYEPTAFYLNESDRLAAEVFHYAVGRKGRYPEMAEGGPSWAGVLMDCNAPEFDTWLHKLIVEEWTEGVEFFRQPGGRSPRAENLKNLPAGYYEDQVKYNPEWYVRRMVDNEFGYARDGKPVFPEFNDAAMVIGDEQPNPNLGLVIGMDAGLSPAAVLKQRMPDGQWVTFDEIISETGTGPERFSDAVNRLLATDPYRDFAPGQIVGWCDPAAVGGVDRRQEGARDWLTTVCSKTGLRVRPAPTNKLIPRLESVRQCMTRNIDGRKPGYVMTGRCPALRKAYNAGYRYRKILIHSDRETRYDERPEKNDHSHIADADQYAHLGGGEYAITMGRRRHTGAVSKRPLYAMSGDGALPGDPIPWTSIASEE